MKLRSISAILAALALTSSAAVFAATDSPQSDKQWLVDASKLEGTAVYDYHGHKLGDLQQVLIDPQSGRIRYGVIEVDKSWSWSDPQVAIPWDAFAIKRGEDKMPALSIDATKEKLEKAPKFKAGDADRLFSKEASQPIYSYWSIYWYEEPSTSSKNNHTGDEPAATKNPSNSSNTSSSNAGGTSNTKDSTPAHNKQ